MNEFLLNPEDQRLIDLLVDGELSAEHRRDLLQRFEQEPAGWRSCALAFLEAQSWRGDLRAFVKEPAPVVAVSAPVATVPAAQRSGYNPAWLVPLYTLAAALLVALGMSVGWKLNPYLPAGAGSAQQFAGSLAGAAQTVSGQSPAGTRPARPWGKPGGRFRQ
jgi:anti-sigma factor RsiW